MKRTAKETTVAARALTNPQPSFVSIVKAGANQRPFRAVKVDPSVLADAVAEAVNQKPEEADVSKKKGIEVMAGFEIAQIVFKGEKFAKKADVEAWLTDGGYSEFTLTEKDDGSFEVTSNMEFEAGSVQKIEGDDGVVAYVGKLKEEAPAEKTADEQAEEHAAGNTSAVQPVATKAEGEEAAAGADASQKTADEVVAELAQRFDSWEAYYSDGKTMKEVMEAGNNGYPGGLYELTEAFYVVVRNAVLSGDLDAIKRESSVYGQMVAKLAEVFMTFAETEKADLTVKVCGPEEITAAEAPVAVQTEAEKSAEEKSAEDEAAKAAAEQAAAEATPEVVDITAALKEALSAALGPIGVQLAEVKEMVVQTKSDLEERVTGLENRGQTRKGADELDPADSKPDTKAEGGASTFSSALGARKKSGAWDK